MKKSVNKKINYSKNDYVINASNDVENNFLNSKIIGVNENEREEIQKEYGKNFISEKKFNHGKKILEILIEPFNILLFFVVLVEFIIFFLYSKQAQEDKIMTLASVITVIIMIVLAGVTDYIQDYKAYLSSVKLHKLVQNKCLVFKEKFDYKKIENPSEIYKYLNSIDESELVVGDVVYLNAGDIVPADCKLIWYDKLFIDESSLTGESELVEKTLINTKNEMIELQNILFSQSIVKKGSCLAIVINVGYDNYAESMLKEENFDKNSNSNFEKGMKKIIRLLIAIILISVPIIFALSWWKSGSVNKWVDALIFAISITVGLIPESLPAIISSNLQIGSKKLSKEKIVVKNLNVVQNLGGVNVLCTDKTGTLTVDEITLDNYFDFNNESTNYLKNLIFVNSFYQKNIQNKMDYAIRAKMEDEQWKENNKFCFVKDFPFDFSTRISSVIVKNDENDLQITKGSIEEILRTVSFVRVGNKVVKMTSKHFEEIENITNKYYSLGFRILGITSKNTNDFEFNDSIFEGFALFSEVLKDGAKETIKKIYDQNIDIKVLTGDAREITLNVANKLEMKNISSISGKELSILDNKKINSEISRNNLFVKLSPYDKAQIVSQLKSDENTIAFMGDGINDAMVIKSADVGISVNNGTPLAKSAASIILLEKNLEVLDNAFMKGREIFANAIKFVKLTIASNLGLLLTLFISSIWFNFQAMTPLQLIIQNLIFDFANLFFVFDSVDKETIKKPVVWKTKTMLPFGIWNGAALTLTSIINFLIMGFGFGLFAQISGGSENALYQFQTAFFIECVMSHIIFIMVMRSKNIIFIKSVPNKIMSFTLFGFALITIIIVISLSYVDGIHFVIPSNEIIFTLIGMIFITILIQEFFKATYKIIFKDWI